MTAPDEAVEAATEFVESIDPGGKGFALALGALLLGAGIGGGVGYILANRRLRTKYAEIADAEIEMMRKHYIAKGVAVEAAQGKGNLSEIVKEKGYTSPEPTMSASPPMAVQPPSRVIIAEDEAAGESPDDSAMAEDDVEGPNGVKVIERNVFRDRQRERERHVRHEWNAAEERKRRSPDRPYVIHQDERYDLEGYSEVSYTYYAEDDVLCDERDEPVDPEIRDNLIGEENLERFGHGCDDPMIVHIRNDNLEIVYEIIKSPNSFSVEVHGMEPPDRGIRHDSGSGYNVERMRRRERDDER